jgi:hypothetical protein
MAVAKVRGRQTVKVRGNTKADGMSMVCRYVGPYTPVRRKL